VVAVEGVGEERVGEERVERLPGNRPPTADERRRLRELYQKLGSKEKVYIAAWGFKNGTVAGYLTEALSESIVEPVLSPEPAAGELVDQVGDRLDLSTEEGRGLWGQLQRSGLVKLPDVSNLLQEGE
jgi:hypothetical protein